MAEQEVRIRVWISEAVSKRLDEYVAAKDAKVAWTVDLALDEFLAQRGF